MTTPKEKLRLTQKKQIEFKHKLATLLRDKTKYHLVDADFQLSMCWFVHNGENISSDDLAFSANINKNGTGFNYINFCLDDIEGGGPACASDNQQDIADFLQAVEVINQYLAK